MRKPVRCSIIVLLLFTAIRVVAAEPTGSGGYHVIKKIAAGGDGGWDYLTLDPVSRHLYISRSNRVMVFDVDKETSVGEVANTPGVHGVALVAKYGRGFASNGGDSSVTSFDLKTLAERKKIKVAGRPDAIMYDPASNQVFTFGSNRAIVIDPEKEESVDTIELGGKPEFGVSDEKGQVFVNLEDKSEVVAIDAIKREVLHHWPLARARAERTGDRPCPRPVVRKLRQSEDGLRRYGDRQGDRRRHDRQRDRRLRLRSRQPPGLQLQS